MKLADIDRILTSLEGVRPNSKGGETEWRFHGRVVARQLDESHIVIRADFDYRDAILGQFPDTFSVPTRFAAHMMVVADLERGDVGAIEDALTQAWRLQRAGR
ncbi:MAG: hypothetical protein ACR2KJ_15515 [Jatrophihabitans sp.]